MHVIRSLFIAFSMYSKLPMPQFEWKDEDMRYSMCFFPFVGIIIGLLVYFWNYICWKAGIGEICRIAFSAAIPVIITGGIHVDGFLDTMDAVHSYQPRERRLEILKDSHIGAFAVIMGMLLVFIFIGAFSEIKTLKAVEAAAFCFFLSRCLSAYAVVSFPAAKKEGTLYTFAGRAHEKRVKAALYIELAAAAVIMLVRLKAAGAIELAAALAAFAYYYYKSKKDFGGITGDIAGCFVTMCEALAVIAAAVMTLAGLC